ncbi:Potassium/sodium hyperpolarization-activated cyclic nucleotide-gated channel 4 [Folsomia candida]|uniref:Potassium/sodium hyperpolarization-activated cyclic nucleotide-gated channel 4 n=1 Tax=Folsomia candida TaxID=158441 RepID=A0A226DKQ2_FOLCA|nr:Potassium/sodium hyperpolarization-activated cyclic nucleotide-gated channel 4 [Folsomia candida]
MSLETILSDMERSARSSWFQKLRRNLRNLFLISINPRINGAAVRYGQAVFKERQRQMEKYPRTIHPYSCFRWYWDILLTIVLLFSLIEKPIQIAFYDIEEEGYFWVTVISTVTSALSFLDIAFNFCTGVPDVMSDTIILERSIIFSKYLRSWFFVDFFSSIPFDTIYYILTSIEHVHPEHNLFFKFIRLLGLLKFFRLIRVVQCLKRIEQAFHISELRIRLINLLVTIITIIHWMSCFHWLSADLFNPPENRKAMSWITKTKLWDKPVWLCYINSVLRTVSNMVTSGYGGGETPTEPEDIVMTLISMALGCTCFGLYIGTMGSIMQRVNASGKKFDEMILEVNEYMKFRNIPPRLQKRMLRYYEQRYRKHYFDENQILENVSDVLRNDLLMHNCKHLIENAPLFRDLPDSFLKMIVQKLTFQEGQVNILSGDGHLISTLDGGDYFGEGSLILDNQKTNANVTAKDYCDIYRLDREDFMEVFVKHPETLAKIKILAQSRRAETDMKTNVSKSLVFSDLPNHETYFNVLRILSILKILRIFRVSLGVRRIQCAFEITEIYTRLLNYILTVLIVAHWLTCLQWLAADFYNPPGHRKPLSWITKSNMWDQPVWFCYINCALRAHSNMLGNGYGIGECPVEPEDIIVFIFCSLIGFSFYGTYISILGSVVEALDSPEKTWMEMMTETKGYMRFAAIRPKLRGRMKLYYEQRYRRKFFHEGDILQSVNDVLRNEVLMFNCRHLLENAPIFREVPTAFLKRIVQKLRFEGRSMYFINEGKVLATTANGEFISLMEAGDHFGEASIVNDNQKTNANIRAKDFCDIYRLDREDFKELFCNHPEILERIKSIARMRKGERGGGNLKMD